MNNIPALISELQLLNIHIWVESGNLRCNAPKGSMTAELKTVLSTQKEQIISFLNEQSSQQEKQAIALISRIEPRTEKLPLSFGQMRLWLLQQLDIGSTVYNLPNAWKITGKLNIDALEKAINEIIRRHEITRTNFKLIDGEPYQIIHPPQDRNIPIVDLQELSDRLQTTKVKILLDREINHVFNLEREPLLRLSLIRLAPEVNILSCNIHHIIFDGWSMEIFFRELSTLYKAYLNRQPSSLPKLSLQYADFAIWEHQNEAKLEQQIAFWREHLQGIPPQLPLPIAQSISTTSAEFHGATQSFAIDVETAAQIKQLGYRENVTPFMLLFAVFAVLIFRYSAEEDLVIGFPIAGRHHHETHQLIGFFVNLLALRVKITAQSPFREFLRLVRQTILSGYEHQDTPFEKVVEAAQPERNGSHSPLFHVIFDWQSAISEPLTLPEVEIESLADAAVMGKFDLSLTISEGAGLKGIWTYNRDLYSDVAIADLSLHFQTLLAGILANPDQNLAKLPLLTSVEQQLLTQWNSNLTPYPHHQCIHHLFEEQVQKTPQALAVLGKSITLEQIEEKITYSELNNRANQLAHYLQKLGVKPDSLVAISIERSLEMIVAVLAVLKAGGAYVPLDPKLPQQRLAFILEDSQAPILLTQENLYLKFSEAGFDKVICLDTDWKLISTSHQLIENPISLVTNENLAYIIYTSGSTGRPKGVEIAHQSLVNFTTMAIQEYGISNSDQVLQFASLSFDTAAEEIYPCLTTGATLVLRNEQMLASSQQFWQQCQDWQITVLDLPTAYWHLLTSDTGDSVNIPHFLKLVIIGGEQALVENLRRWQQKIVNLPNPPKLVNTYGPTEATIVTTIYPFPNSISVWETPIGKPIGNTQVYVLDKYLQPVPIGVAGELHIGGTGLARGYLNRPELTQEKFIPNPFATGEIFPLSNFSNRLYKTGDLVRFRPDGNLEFLGRIDNQVKIRGFRIEIGEIEAAIAQHPLVRMNAVITQVEPSGDKRLVAYIVPQADITTNLSINEVKEFLQHKLPDYMIPIAWVKLDNLPLTANGKVDYRSLPKVTAQVIADSRFVAPRNDLEQQIAEIWGEVLNLSQVSIHDNFFELGGHSLLAFTLMNRVQQQFGKALPLASIFQGATVAKFANLLNQEAKHHDWSLLVKIQPGSEALHGQPPLFLIHPGGASLLAYEDLIGCLGKSRPIYGLDARGFEEGQTPQETVEEMAIQYLKAIQDVQPQGPYLFMGWCFGGLIAFEMAQLLRSQGQRTTFLGLIDTFIRSGEEPLEEINLLFALFSELFAVKFPMEKLRQMEPDERLNNIYQHAKATNRLPANFSLERIKRLFAVGKSHDLASVKYFPQPYPDQITLIRAKEGNFHFEKPTMGWEIHAAEVDLHWTDGNHLSMFHHPHVQKLADKLKFCLDQSLLPSG
ncbi:MAG: amino acid adenylation domain-containing protein [Aphanizomenon gracile PMC638.10]|nr:amino acid adenylation domain-containing protein [Aphanizomenon gracile PMC638.10]